MKNLIVKQITVKTLRNNFDLLIEQIKANIDILMILERKLDESFPISQFQIDGYRMRTKMANKWFMNPIKAFIGEQVKLLSKNLDLQSSKYDHFVFIGDCSVGRKMKQ